MHSWAELTYLAGAQADRPAPGWADPDQAVLDHMREILGGSLFQGCGQPDCPSCNE